MSDIDIAVVLFDQHVLSYLIPVLIVKSTSQKCEATFAPVDEGII